VSFWEKNMLKISRIETILKEIQTPVYVCEELLLEQNLTLLKNLYVNIVVSNLYQIVNIVFTVATHVSFLQGRKKR